MPLESREYHYTSPDNGIDEPIKFTSIWNAEEEYQQTWIAEKAAKHFFDNCDGWESSWPIEITVVGVGTFRVEIEYDPTFMVTRVHKDIAQ